MLFPVNKNASLKQSNFEKIPSADEILQSSVSLRAGEKLNVKPSLISQVFGKINSYQAKKADAKANKLAFAELAPQSAVTKKAIKTQPSVESILADSLAVREGAYKGPSLGSKMVSLFSSFGKGVKNAVMGLGSAIASLFGAIAGLFSKAKTSLTQTSNNKKASKELVGDAFVQETVNFVATQKNSAMKAALVEAENLALSQLIEGKVVAEVASDAIALRSKKK